MSWTEWTDTLFRGLDLKQLKVDQAYLNVSNALNEPLFLYTLSEECVKCPFKFLRKIARQNDTVVKLDVARNLYLRLVDEDYGEYLFPNETGKGLQWSAQPQLGEFGVYDLKIMDSKAIRFETAKEPVFIYTCKLRQSSLHRTKKIISFFPSNVPGDRITFRILLDLQIRQQILLAIIGS